MDACRSWLEKRWQVQASQIFTRLDFYDRCGLYILAKIASFASLQLLSLASPSGVAKEMRVVSKARSLDVVGFVHQSWVVSVRLARVTIGSKQRRERREKDKRRGIANFLGIARRRGRPQDVISASGGLSRVRRPWRMTQTRVIRFCKTPRSRKPCGPRFEVPWMKKRQKACGGGRMTRKSMNYQPTD